VHFLPVQVAIEPKLRQDVTKLFVALEKLAENDPDFCVETDLESDQIILCVASERDLERVVAKLVRDTGLGVNVGAPQAAYRETLSRPLTIKYTLKKQTAGSGQFAEVTIHFEPLSPGAGFVFRNGIANGAIPKELIPAVEKGLAAQKESGLLAGFPVIDFQATLMDGKYHEVDSNAMTFDIAARAAFRELATKSVITLLEPLMKLEVIVPEEFIGTAIGDINSRRGRVQGIAALGNTQMITALIPVSGMFGYQNTIMAITQGRATWSTQFERFERVPNVGGDDDPRIPPGAAALRVA
jgi:elongation factor G